MKIRKLRNKTLLALLIGCLCGCASISGKGTDFKSRDTEVSAEDGSDTNAVLPLNSSDRAFVRHYYTVVTGAPFCPNCPPPDTQSWIALQTTDMSKAWGIMSMPLGTYTYVLIPALGYYQASGEAVPEGLMERSTAVLDAIRTQVRWNPNGQVNAQVPFSLFLVPMDNTSGDYGAELAHSVLESMLVSLHTTEGEVDLGMSLGPLLVSVNKPHFELQAGDPVLWLDLESTPVSSIAQIIREYRRRIHGEPISTTEEFEGFLVSFLEFIGNLDIATDAVKASMERLRVSPDYEEREQ